MALNMKKVMIVDDEALVREMLRKTVPWEEHGFEVIGEAACGEEALSVFEKAVPDIVITDIVMGDMTGLDLIEEIKKRSAKTEFIILSGFDDFKYAKRAIENGIFAYLLKPLKEHEILEAILHLREHIEHKQNTDHALAKYDSYKRNELLYKLLQTGPLDKKGADTVCKQYNLQLPANNYLIAIFQLDRCKDNTDRHNAFLALNERIEYHVSMDEHYILNCRMDESNVVLMIFTSENERIFSKIEKLLCDMKHDFNELTGYGVTIGISGVCRNLSMINRAYRQALSAVSQKALLGGNRIIDFTLLKTDGMMTPAMPDDTMDAVIKGIKNRRPVGEIQALIEEYFAQVEALEEIDLSIVKNSILELCILILREVVRNSHFMVKTFGRMLKPTIEIQEIELITELKNYVTEMIGRVYQSEEIGKLTGYSMKVQQIIQYMMDHYAKPITVQSVADEFHITTYYLMHMLKRETGKTFNEYLSEYRMSVANTLLQSGKYKIYEVCYMVGYNDTRHFSKKFKSIMGKKPSDIKVFE